jgi:hypothetical protein
MSKFKSLLVALALASSASAQNYPLPASVSEPPAICTNCWGTNASGENNVGRPTYPYDAPLDFVGRYLDSSTLGRRGTAADGTRFLRIVK